MCLYGPVYDKQCDSTESLVSSVNASTLYTEKQCFENTPHYLFYLSMILSISSVKPNGLPTLVTSFALYSLSPPSISPSRPLSLSLSLFHPPLRCLP